MADIKSFYSDISGMNTGKGADIIDESSLILNDIYTSSDEDLNDIQDFMLDLGSGKMLMPLYALDEF